MDPQVETTLAEERRKRVEAEAALAQEKRKVAALETEFFTELGHIWTGQSEIASDTKDKRFLDQTWANHPLYKAYRQTYLLWNQSLHAFVDNADLTPREADRARFVLSLFTEAVAPTNTMLGNPAAMKRLYETGGTSAVRGLVHMLEDLAKT